MKNYSVGKIHFINIHDLSDCYEFVLLDTRFQTLFIPN